MIERVLGRRAMSPRRLPTFLLLILLVVGGGLGYAFHLLTEPSVVHIEPVNSPGAEPAFIPAAAASAAVPQRPVHAIGHIVTGDTEGLYGGTETSSCDASAIRTFLDTHPEPATAWAGALRLAPTDIGRFLDSLTALTLRTDTAVTNHGYRDGRATPFQSVLQAGTSVLVDAEGLPRVRCFCGNPLQTPVPATNPRFVGQPWTGFEPESVTVIAQATREVKEFVVLDHDSDQVVTRPRATRGEADRPVDESRKTQVLANYQLNTSSDGEPNGGGAVDPNSSGATAAGPGDAAAAPVPGQPTPPAADGSDTSSQSYAAYSATGLPGGAGGSDDASATGTSTPAGTAPPTVGSAESTGAPLTETAGPPAGLGGTTPAKSQAPLVTTSSNSDRTTTTTTSKTTTGKTTTGKTTTGKTTTSKTTTSKTTTSKTTTKKSPEEESESG